MSKSGLKDEAKRLTIDGNMDLILGVHVTGTTEQGVLMKIVNKCAENGLVKPLFVVTAYSEFFLRAQKDPEFLKLLNHADMVLPDGVSVAAALDYRRLRSGKPVADFLQGLRVGARILAGEYADKKIEGVKLTREILKIAGRTNRRVFLLGGKLGVSGRLALMMKRDFKQIQIESDEGEKNIRFGEKENTRILEKINFFKPDILFVAYGMPWQEKWIAGNLARLNAKVVIGVGSSFDEIMKEGPWRKPVPGWVNTMGLKWLWRVTVDRKHWRRAWNAFPVFAWKVYRSPGG